MTTLLETLAGCRDVLLDSAAQLRARQDEGYALVCEMTAAKADKAIAEADCGHTWARHYATFAHPECFVCAHCGAQEDSAEANRPCPGRC